MFRLIRNLIRICILLFVVALLFNFHYHGKSTREYAKEYSIQLGTKFYNWAKGFVGKDVEELTPKIFPKIKEEVKKIDFTASPPEPKKSEATSSRPLLKQEGQWRESEGKKEEAIKKETATPRPDGISERDRESLKNLLKQKTK